MLDQFFQNYHELEQMLARTQLALFMLGMGSTLSMTDFAVIFRNPRSLLVGLTGQMLLAPVLAFLIGLIADVSVGVLTGLVLVASLPGGNMSKMFAYIARGNIALAITMSAVGTLLCVGTIPLIFRLFLPEVLSADSTRWVEVEIVAELVFFLLTPVFVGMLFARLAPQYQEPFSRWTIRLGFVVAALMVVGSLGSGRIDTMRLGWSVPLAIIVYCILAQQLPMIPFRMFRWPDPDCVSVGIESTMRNINLSLALIALLFPPGSPSAAVGNDVLFVALYYGGTAFFLGIPLSLRMRRVIRRQQESVADSLAHTGEPMNISDKVIH